MQAVLIENNETGRVAYDSLVVAEPKMLHALGNKLAMKIVQEIGKSPTSPIDIARKLKQHEQKVYYHINKLEKAGIIYPISTERRQGMTAKIYSVVSPVIAAKLYDKGVEVKDTVTTFVSSEVREFFSPFIVDGKLNAKIIVGSPQQHGKYDATARDTPALIDLTLFMGTLMNSVDSSCYKLDTDVTEEELKKNNIILIGNPKINNVTDKINHLLPIKFDSEKNFSIISSLTGNIYKYDYDSVILKLKNPFNEDKDMLLLAGQRSVGLKSAVLAVIKHINAIVQGNVKDKNLIAKVVTGVDKDSDGVIDDAKILE